MCIESDAPRALARRGARFRSAIMAKDRCFARSKKSPGKRCRSRIGVAQIRGARRSTRMTGASMHGSLRARPRTSRRASRFARLSRQRHLPDAMIIAAVRLRIAGPHRRPGGASLGLARARHPDGRHPAQRVIAPDILVSASPRRLRARDVGYDSELRFFVSLRRKRWARGVATGRSWVRCASRASFAWNWLSFDGRRVAGTSCRPSPYCFGVAFAYIGGVELLPNDVTPWPFGKRRVTSSPEIDFCGDDRHGRFLMFVERTCHGEWRC